MTLSESLQRVGDAIRARAAEMDFLPLDPPELQEASEAYFSRGGKYLRPALCLCVAHALGGEGGARRALSSALATELFHLFTLVHDDVIDHDTLRRGERCAHVLARDESGIPDPEKAAEYGIAAAILAGDALFARSVELIARDSALSESARLLLIRKLCSHTLPLLLSGEALDTKLSYLSGIPDEETLTAVYRNKTGVLFGFALYAGAVCALDGEPDAAFTEAIESAAAHIGKAFQLTDDYLGLTLDEKQMGKSALSDIREGKRTYLVRFAAEHADERETSFLFSVLGSQTATQDEILKAREILVRLSRKDYEAHVCAALRGADELLRFLPDGEGREMLAALFERMIHRES